MKATIEDIERVKENLAFIEANPGVDHLGWVEAVRVEARSMGLLPPTKAVVGVGCRPGIDHGIVYGGDMEDVF